MKKNIKRLLVLLSASFILLFGLFIFIQNNNSFNDEISNNDNSNSTVVEVVYEELPVGSIADAMRIDTEKEIDKLLKKADLIIEGTIIGADVGGVSTEYLVEVTEVIKGKKIETVKVLELNGNTTLKIDSNLIFVLNKQDVDDELVYYATGGEQGIFYYHNGVISNTDTHMKSELKNKFFDESNELDNKEAKKDFKDFIKEITK